MAPKAMSSKGAAKKPDARKHAPPKTIARQSQATTKAAARKGQPVKTPAKVVAKTAISRAEHGKAPDKKPAAPAKSVAPSKPAVAKPSAKVEAGQSAVKTKSGVKPVAPALHPAARVGGNSRVPMSAAEAVRATACRSSCDSKACCAEGDAYSPAAGAQQTDASGGGGRGGRSSRSAQQPVRSRSTSGTASRPTSGSSTRPMASAGSSVSRSRRSPACRSSCSSSTSRRTR